VLDPLLVSIPRSDTSTLDLFPDAGRYDEDLQSAQLSPAVGEISPLDFDIDVHQDSDKPVFMAQGTLPGMRMITQLRAAILQLPEAVALATPADELARFSGDPADESRNYDDPWEMVDQALNAVVGYGRTTADIAGLIRKGRNGMDGLCNWLEVCIEVLRIDPVLLEGKMSRLLEAMALL
jgi:hypothetical protein